MTPASCQEGHRRRHLVRGPEHMAQNACIASTPLATRDAAASLTLIIGVGNPERSDDGAGREVARQLRALALPAVVVREATGEASELLDAWNGHERVILVDASSSGRRPGTVTRFDASAAPLPAALARASTHGWGVAEAIELARALGRLPGSVVIYAIEGRSFEPGTGLSLQVRRAVARVVDALAARPSAAPAPARS